MKRPTDLVIDRDDPWANDDLARKPQGDALGQFISTIQGSYVISLRAPWGAGKSIFLRRLECDLERRSPLSIPVIRLDAWRNDYLEDALLAFVGAINERLKQKEGKGKAAASKVISKMAELGGKLCGPVAGALALALVPGGETIAKFAEALTKTSDVLLQQQKAHQESVDGFREQLVKARDILTERIAGETIRPIVFMIDELDRCRPDFAIRALERIKHFFDVEGIIFLIATDGANLPAAVSAVYGIKQHPERYLRKFLDFEFRLPAPTASQFVKYLCVEFGVEDLTGGTKIEHVMQEINTGSHQYQQNGFHQKYVIADVVRIFPEVATSFHLSLRDQIQAFTMVTATIRAAPSDLIILARLLVTCVALRFASHDEFEDLSNGDRRLAWILSEPFKGDHPAFAAFLKDDKNSAYFPLINRILEQPDRKSRHSYIESVYRNDGDKIGAVFPFNSLMALTGLPVDYLQQLLALSSTFAPSRVVPRKKDEGLQ